jgi:threonine/homoserine/homoserine lactone efflux protein
MNFALFVLTHLFSVLSPGQTLIGITNYTLKKGFAPGVLFVCGATVGYAIWICLAFFGLSKVIFSSSVLSAAFYACGGAYLIFLGIKLLLEKKEARPQEQALGNPFWAGFLVELSNPKSILFASTLIAMGATPSSSLSFKIVVMVWIGLVGAIYEFGIVCLLVRFRFKIFKYIPLLNNIFGVLLLLFAAKLFWEAAILL